MQTTEQDLLKVKRGEWIKINPLRDLNKIKQLTNNLIKKSEDFVFNDEGTHFFRRSLDPFDLVGQLGYEAKTRTLGYGKQCRDLYFNGKLIAIGD